MRLGYLGLGSNVGDRRANLQAAVEDLWAHDVVVLASSSVYETEPVGEVLDQPDFYNACVRIETPLDAGGAARRLQGGRARARAASPAASATGRARSTSTCCCSRASSTSPSGCGSRTARCTSRRFVLVPLLELDPDLEITGGGRAADALAALGPGQEVRRAGPPLDVRRVRGAPGRAGGARARGRASRRRDLLRRARARPGAWTSRASRRRSPPPRTSRAPTRSGSGAAPRRARSPTPAASRCGSSARAATATVLEGSLDLGEDESSVAALAVRAPRSHGARAARRR